MNTCNLLVGPGRYFALMLLVTSWGALTPLPTSAQQAADTSSLEEITVTARKREESLQRVPISITAFTATQIERAGIERPQDFVALTPGVSMTNLVTISAGDAQIQIRGLLNSRDTEANFALVVDGVLQTNPNALTQELTNIQQIEVLKGPQGALYGRNAVAGAILIDTKKPTNEFSGEVKLGWGNFDTKKAVTTLGGALIKDALLASATVAYHATAGEFRNVYLDRHDVDNYRDVSARGRLMWVGTDGLTLDMIGNYEKVNSSAINFNAVVANPTLATIFNTPSFFENVNDHKFVYANNVPPENELKREGVSLKSNYDAGAFSAMLTLAWNDQKESFLADGTSGGFGQYFGNSRVNCSTTLPTLNDPALQPLPFSSPTVMGSGIIAPYTASACDGYQYEFFDQRDKSVELRLTSAAAQQWRWIAGLYFADIDREVANSYGADLSGTAANPNNVFLAQPYVPPSGPNPTDQLFWDQYSTKVYSVFGDLTREFNDAVEISVSGRFDDEERHVHNLVPNVSSGVLAGNINPAFDTATSIPDRKLTFTKFQPKATVRWNASEQKSLYASYGVGFRSGGFNPQGTTDLVKQYYNNTSGAFGTVNAGLNIGDTYKAEVVNSYEIGFKSEWLDRRLRISGAAFRENVTNGQFFEVLVGSFGLVRTVSNIDKSHINGFEVGVDGRPTEWLTLDTSFVLLDTRIDDNSNRPYTVGNRLPHVPAYTLNAGAQADRRLSDNLQLVARVDFQRLGQTWFHTVQDNVVPTMFGSNADFSRLARDPFNLVNVRLGLQGNRWDATLWSRNVFNKEYITEVSAAPEFGGGFASPGHGRTFGADVAYRF